MEAQFARFGLSSRYTRFRAIDGSSAAMPQRAAIRASESAAFLSHMTVLEGSHPHKTPIHILEDDALVSAHSQPVIEQAIATGLFERFDVLFTDTLVSPHLGMLKAMKSTFDRIGLISRPLQLTDLQVIDLAQQDFACLTSYVVAPRSVNRILQLYRTEWEAGPEKPADLFIRDCVHAGKLRAALLFPFVTGFRLDEIAASTIAAGAPFSGPSVMVLAVLRHLFFVDRDLNFAKSCLDAVTSANRRTTNRHHDMIAQALEFVLSDDFQQF
jgi:GR25 family glycosyltransferase involved in LPS biosynthesis